MSSYSTAVSQEYWLHNQLLTDVDLYNSAYYASISLISLLRCFGNMIGVLCSFLCTLLLWAYPDIVRGAPGKASARKREDLYYSTTLK